MTIPSSVTTARSPLAAHLSDMQSAALRTEVILQALDALIDFPEHKDTCIHLIEAGGRLAAKINAGLDSNTLPEDRA